MDINEQKNYNKIKFNQNELNFEKMNETLANPEFANWYYNEMQNKDNHENFTITDFFHLVNDYSKRKN